MEIGIQDKVLEKIQRLHGLAVEKIKDTTKGKRPFASEKVDPEQVIYWKNTLGYNDLGTLLQEFGPETINKLLYEIHVMEQRRIENGTIPAPEAAESLIAKHTENQNTVGQAPYAAPTQAPQAPVLDLQRRF